jgi:ATP-dependent Zn protease
MSALERSLQNYLDGICGSLAGRAAEVLVFGIDACSSGGLGDMRQATEAAVRFVRHQGFSTRLSHTDLTNDSDDKLKTNAMPSTQLIF